ncbi:MAG TPA: signal peptidase II [Acidimicrobiales bacterium]|nr:signal peptidase II [Acidimicrobiales bacterium]
MRVLQERRPVVSTLTAPDHPVRRRAGLVVAVAAAAAGLDQVTKTVAISTLARGGVLDCAAPDAPPRHAIWTLWWVLTCNSGAAFGLGRGVTPVVEVVVVGLVAALVVSGRRATGRLQAVGTGLLLGGAVGNLVDRVARGNGGAVIDFIDAVRVGAHDRWPVFNVADACIVCGAAALAVGWGRRPDAGARG